MEVMTDRKSFLQRASQQKLSIHYEKEAADGLDYLGSQEEIESGLENLEKKLGIAASTTKSFPWIWVAASAIILVTASVFLLQTTSPTKQEILANAPKPKGEELIALLESKEETKNPIPTIRRQDPPKIESNTNDALPLVEKDQPNAVALNSEPPIESDATGQPQKEKLFAGTDDQDKQMVVSDLAAPKTLAAPKKIGRGTWEEQLIHCGVWDGKENLFPTRIPATVVDGKLKLKRTPRFSDSKWNSLDSLIQNYSENDLRKGSIELLLPLR